MTSERVGTHFYGDGCPHHRDRPDNVPIEDRVTTSQIAKLLGVDPKTVNRWAERRSSTGFPHHLGYRLREKGKGGFQYDFQEVQEWYKFWKLTRRNSGPRQSG